MERKRSVLGWTAFDHGRVHLRMPSGTFDSRSGASTNMQCWGVVLLTRGRPPTPFALVARSLREFRARVGPAFPFMLGQQ
eukprot:12349317-Alexandrium_andersonii.AAC.1